MTDDFSDGMNITLKPQAKLSIGLTNTPDIHLDSFHYIQYILHSGFQTEHSISTYSDPKIHMLNSNQNYSLSIRSFIQGNLSTDEIVIDTIINYGSHSNNTFYLKH